MTAHDVIKAHGFAIFWANMNLQGLSPSYNALFIDIRIQIDLAQCPFRHHGIGCCPLMFLIIPHKMLDGSGNSVLLQTLNIRSGHGS